MKKIELTQNQYAIVDDDIYEELNKWKWHATSRNKKHYAARKCYKKGYKNPVYIHMHRFVLNVETFVDHINGNSLDNRRENLRVCTQAQNAKNSQRKSQNKSGYKGVCWSSYHKKWKSEIKLNYKAIFIGYFEDKISAAKAYNNTAIKYHGEFAKLNEIPHEDS